MVSTSSLKLRASGSFSSLMIFMAYIATTIPFLSSSVPRPYMRSPTRVTLNGSRRVPSLSTQFSGVTGTTSAWA
ncbi:hypothetical protein D3C84_874310 [compost metagenome]